MPSLRNLGFLYSTSPKRFISYHTALLWILKYSRVVWSQGVLFHPCRVFLHSDGLLRYRFDFICTQQAHLCALCRCIQLGSTRASFCLEEGLQGSSLISTREHQFRMSRSSLSNPSAAPEIRFWPKSTDIFLENLWRYTHNLQALIYIRNRINDTNLQFGENMQSLSWKNVMERQTCPKWSCCGRSFSFEVFTGGVLPSELLWVEFFHQSWFGMVDSARRRWRTLSWSAMQNHEPKIKLTITLSSNFILKLAQGICHQFNDGFSAQASLWVPDVGVLYRQSYKGIPKVVDLKG